MENLNGQQDEGECRSSTESASSNESIRINQDLTNQEAVEGHDIIETITFNLIPFTESEKPRGNLESIERKLKMGQVLKIGRKIVHNGVVSVKGNKKTTDLDIWFVSKVVSRLHAEIWAKSGQLYLKDVGSSSGTFLNTMRLSPSGKESRPYPLK